MANPTEKERQVKQNAIMGGTKKVNKITNSINSYPVNSYCLIISSD